MKSVFDKMTVQLQAGNVVLSTRELDTARAYNMGDSYHEIADSMGLSHRTIETFANRIIKKTKAKNLRHACHVLRLRMVLQG